MNYDPQLVIVRLKCYQQYELKLFGLQQYVNRCWCFFCFVYIRILFINNLVRCQNFPAGGQALRWFIPPTVWPMEVVWWTPHSRNQVFWRAFGNHEWILWLLEYLQHMLQCAVLFVLFFLQATCNILFNGLTPRNSSEAVGFKLSPFSRAHTIKFSGC